MGFDWPASPFFGAIVVMLLLALWFHSKGLLKCSFKDCFSINSLTGCCPVFFTVITCKTFP